MGGCVSKPNDLNALPEESPSVPNTAEVKPDEPNADNEAKEPLVDLSEPEAEAQAPSTAVFDDIAPEVRELTPEVLLKPEEPKEDVPFAIAGEAVAAEEAKISDVATPEDKKN